MKYTYYQDNKNLKLKTVVTVSGNVEYSVNCIKREAGYFAKGKDIFLVNDRWYPVEKLFLDHEKGEYRTTPRGMKHGVINVEQGVLKFGYFTPNPYKNCIIHDMGDLINCIDYKMLDEKSNLFIEDISKGHYYVVANITRDKLEYIQQKRTVNGGKNEYNIIDNKENFLNVCSLYNKSEFTIEKQFKKVEKYIKNITFGIEIETINGNLPEHIKNKYGVIICKDGSTKDENGNYPPEYVTVPMSGAKGLQAIKNLSKEIAKRSDIDLKCSYHLHIGGFEKSRLFLVSLMKLCNKIQDDVFKMFPLYKTDEIKYAHKEKNYCKKLPNMVKSYGSGNFNDYINTSYEDLYYFLSGGVAFDATFNFKTKRNPWGNNKWQIASRYYWVNFTNIVFGKHDTVEFRLHTPTTNSDKIINWLLMCNAIIEYAKNYTMKCISKDKVSFIDVLNFYGKKYNTSYTMSLSQNLINYYQKRVEKFKQDTLLGDYLSITEIIEDANHSHNVLNINL